MATCNLCPPGSRDVPDDEMAEHLRAAHPQVAEDGTLRSDDSTIVQDAAPGPATEGQPGAEQWRS
ncbi:MAG TPA: hypothetical protein VGB74_07415 [Actinoplanes sp.]|jgi:hypothetical protein